jgi:hypothetical protein
VCLGVANGESNGEFQPRYAIGSHVYRKMWQMQMNNRQQSSMLLLD